MRKPQHSAIMKPMIKTIALVLAYHLGYADQNIEIVGGNSVSNPKIAVVDFTNDINGNNATSIMLNDLKITGEFTVKEYASINDVESGTNYVISGVMNQESGNYTVNYTLQATSVSGALLSQNASLQGDNLRAGVHGISNNVYQKLTNTPGIFTTKIAYINQLNNKYNLIVSDYDGYNGTTLVSTRAPLSSLAWNSTGTQISYVSYETGKPIVYVQNLYKGNRYKVANFNGSNSSPAFTPDDVSLAVTLTQDDASHIYLVKNKEFNSKATANEFINFGTIDTEASFAPNGNVVFTSDHDGGPQIFMTNMKGATPTRLTQNIGNYNTTARFSHDSNKVVFINRNFGVLQTYILDLNTRTLFPISMNTSHDIAPSFAPNDKLVLFSSDDNLYIVNATGTIQTKLTVPDSNMIDQRWSNNY